MHHLPADKALGRDVLLNVKRFLQKTSAQVCLCFIRAYQTLISPLLPPSCRYTPTCSQYAMDAIHRYGTWRGMYLACRRILRCHPFNEGGFDPVE